METYNSQHNGGNIVLNLRSKKIPLELQVTILVNCIHNLFLGTFSVSIFTSKVKKSLDFILHCDK